ncbi:MAG: flavodoxin family protein [Gammaproteobacteria bacterium]
MSEPRHLLVVFHSQSGSTAAMAGAVLDGVRDPAVDGVELRVLDPLEAGPDDVRWADALILGTPENFGYMSGALKYFFDHVYYPCLDDCRGLGYALFVKAGNDGRGAEAAVERIVTGLGWRALAPPVVVRGELGDADLDACRELGLTIAAGLEAGLF